ncbi:MAG TPA: bifunctional riboflavin kinase/FAD synthetase [Dehalococcoidia bacterium]|nr:bifunctional riboflavin kinase/FAD synthetase [Dehalococcoidia bacterium]
MSIEEELARLSPTRNTVITVGVFDGVHLGHKYLLAELVKNARKDNLISVVVTFRKHPQSLFEPSSGLKFLASLPQKIKLLKEEGVEVVITLDFTFELAQIGTRSFIGMLKKYLKMNGLVVGPDFAMGRNREGDIDTLRSLEKDMCFKLTVVPPVVKNSEPVSSTVIRNALATGSIKKANEMLGRYFSLEGRVIVGSGRGSDLGFPTANLDIDPMQALPMDGVYATLAYIDGKPYPSITNIGIRPTFDEKERAIEVHIFDYNCELYRHNLKIDIINRLRGEHRFRSAEELVKRITEDIIEARSILSHLDSY